MPGVFVPPGFVARFVGWHVGRGDGGDLTAGGAEDDQLRAGAVGERLRAGEVCFLPGPGLGVGGGQGSRDVVARLVALGCHQPGGLAAYRDHRQHREQRHRADPDEGERGE